MILDNELLCAKKHNEKYSQAKITLIIFMNSQLTKSNCCYCCKFISIK